MKKILVVDDEADILDTIIETLEVEFGESMSIQKAMNGLEALSKIENEDPYDLLSDASNVNTIFYSSSSGISSNTLYPSIMGVGTHTIIATLTNNNGCSADIEVPVTIVATDNLQTEDLVSCDLPGEYIDLRDAVNISGGVFESRYSFNESHVFELIIEGSTVYPSENICFI